MSTEKRPGGAGQHFSTALAEAQNIVEAARVRAAEIEAAAQQLYRDAHGAGYREGFLAGQSEAADAAVRMIGESGVISERLAEQAARLALAICRTIIAEHVKVDPGTAKHLAQRALQESVVGDTVTIFVNPDDDPAISGAIEEMRRLAGGARITIEKDPSISRGGSKIRTDFGEVDASIEALVSAVATKLGIR